MEEKYSKAGTEVFFTIEDIGKMLLGESIEGFNTKTTFMVVEQ